jgi:hypothetical protein
MQVADFVGGILGRHEQHAVQRKRVGRLSRDGEMRIMDRVKRAAEDRNPRRH